MIPIGSVLPDDDARDSPNGLNIPDRERSTPTGLPAADRSGGDTKVPRAALAEGAAGASHRPQGRIAEATVALRGK